MTTTAGQQGRVRVRHAGDAGVLLQLGSEIDAAVNDRAIAVAAVVRSAALAGVRDVVSTFTSVAIYFDPLAIDADRIERLLVEAATQVDVVPTPGHHVDVPVVYGGVDGPDLAAVASYAGLDEHDVIERHAGVTYRVFMLGFQPGFPYLGLVDPVMAMARHASPRLRIPAGSVGIAGRQTGIYPFESPGGWQVIGRTSQRVFDAARPTPALFAPGDTVRFVPQSGAFVAAPVPAVSPSIVPTARTATVVNPGLLTTVQDAGRWGLQGSGVPIGGALDPIGLAQANRAVGNADSAPALEVTLAGPELRLDHEAVVAVAGADLSATIDGERLPLCKAWACPSGAVLRFGTRGQGVRAYLAFADGLEPSPLWPRPPIRRGDVLAVRDASRREQAPRRSMTSTFSATDFDHVAEVAASGGTRLRILPGPQDDGLESALDALVGARFTVSPQSNRMGYRLQPSSPAIAERLRALASAVPTMISDATFPGGIQLPPSGEPILLLADRQTTGGYPQVATVISADLPRAGQLAPGEWIEFTMCSRPEALGALRAVAGVVHG